MRKSLLVFVILGLAAVPVLAYEIPEMHSTHRSGANGRAVSNPDVDAVVVWLQQNYSTKQLQEDLVVVGDPTCVACHSWASITYGVKHKQALRTPFGANSLVAGKGVVADYDQNGVDDFMQGLDFNTISTPFDQFKPNAPVLSYIPGNDSYWITIADLTVRVVITQGGTGDWKQRYLVRVPVTGTGNGWTRDNYVSPVQYNEKTHEYVTYHPEHWWDSNGEPIFGANPPVQDVADVGRSYSKRCIGCHTTNFRLPMSQASTGEWIYRPFPTSLVPPGYEEQYPDYDHDGLPDNVNVGCEACHGPGSAHVIAGGDPEYILAPSSLDTEASNQICQQCHIRTKSAPAGTFGYPYDDDHLENWIPGVTDAPLTDYYIESAGLWPDGRTSRQHHQQYEDFYTSSKPTFEFHMIKCVECHSPHKGGKHMIVSNIVDNGLEIATENNNNTLCLACHATHGAFEDITPEEVAEYDENIDHIGNVVAAHSNHPYAPERSMGLSRCSKCHMPKTAKSAINYDVHGHTFEPIAPEKTLMYQVDGGMPNACAVSCHSQKVNSFGNGYDPDIGVWNEQFDVDLANALSVYYGPGGMWWDTALMKSMTLRILDHANPPGMYDPSEADANAEEFD